MGIGLGLADRTNLKAFLRDEQISENHYRRGRSARGQQPDLYLEQWTALLYAPV